MKGKDKLEAIRASLDGKEFEYIGDSHADTPIWKSAKIVGFVNASNLISRICCKDKPVSVEINTQRNRLLALVRAMRPHQWAKNLLIFAALLFSHSYFDETAVLSCILMFTTFCLSASGIYIINDLLDIESDRAHPKKRLRPFAAGELKPLEGIVASVVLITTSILFTFLFLNIWSLLLLIIYLCVTTSYSFYLKYYSTIDVITLAGLYTIRIVIGATTIGTMISPWLANFSIFFFLSLAYIKRYVELSEFDGVEFLKGRGYGKDDKPIVQTIGIVNGGLAVLTFALYLNSEFVVQNYKTPQLLWLICPVLLFWIYRAWMWARRGKIDSDPVVFALKDRISLASILLITILFVVSKFLN